MRLDFVHLVGILALGHAVCLALQDGTGILVFFSRNHCKGVDNFDVARVNNGFASQAVFLVQQHFLDQPVLPMIQQLLAKPSPG